MHRSLTIVFLALGLAGCWGDCGNQADAPAPKPDRSAEVADLQGRLEASQGNLRSANDRAERMAADRSQAWDNLKENSKAANLALANLFNPKGIVEPVMNEVDSMVLSYEYGAVKLFQEATTKSLGNDFGHQIAISAMDGMIASPDMARVAFDLTMPMMVRAARTVFAKYPSLELIITKSYDPYIGKLAATDGHDCRSEFATAEQKTEKCQKVFAVIGAHYGTVDFHLVEALGVTQRRYENEKSLNHEGFTRVRYMARELVAATQRKS
jgi:hypothetical protein